MQATRTTKTTGLRLLEVCHYVERVLAANERTQRFTTQVSVSMLSRAGLFMNSTPLGELVSVPAMVGLSCFASLLTVGCHSFS